MIMTYSLDDSIVAIATSYSNQALSILRCSGKDCIPLVASVFSSPRKLKDAKGNTTLVGYIMEEKNKIDQVVLCVYRSPKSFTGEDVIEIIAHGSSYTTLSIYNLLIKKGFRAAEKGEFSFRAFSNSKINLTQAEGIRLLSSAKTKSEARLALSQVENKFFTLITTIKSQVLNLIAMLDVVLEYPEDEIAFDMQAFQSSSSKILDDLSRLLKRWERNSLFVNGARVVIAGRANAGKSSLFNSLLNEERSIVSHIAGTTRDYIDGHVIFNGLPCHLYDSAGLRCTKDEIEALGVERAKQIMENSHLVLYLIDGSVERTENEKKEDIEALKACRTKIIFVFTKKDIAKVQKTSIQAIKNSHLETAKYINISVKLDEGIEELVQMSYEALLEDEKGDEEDVGIISEMQKTFLDKAKNHFQLAHDYVSLSHIQGADSMPLDLVMEELEAVLNCLSGITGEVRSDDVLSAVFSQFCVGK